MITAKLHASDRTTTMVAFSFLLLAINYFCLKQIFKFHVKVLPNYVLPNVFIILFVSITTVCYSSLSQQFVIINITVLTMSVNNIRNITSMETMILIVLVKHSISMFLILPLFSVNMSMMKNCKLDRKTKHCPNQPSRSYILWQPTCCGIVWALKL